MPVSGSSPTTPETDSNVLSANTAQPKPPNAITARCSGGRPGAKARRKPRAPAPKSSSTCSTTNPSANGQPHKAASTANR